MPFGRWWHLRGRGYCRGKPGLSGEYAPESARVEGSPIVDEPGECSTPVRENRRHEPRGFSGKSCSLTTVCFLPTRANKERQTGKILGAFFRDAQGFDGWTLARAPASLAQDLHRHGPRYFVWP